MAKGLPIMIQGTHSDAGKSVLATAFCRIFADEGYKTAPFKSQNMALNSYITIDGKEIGRAQGVQAEAARVIATTDMNPILIKPTREHSAQIVVHGKPYKNMEAMSYRRDFFEQGLELITEAYERLSSKYERIVIEGAGSPAEINLNDRELVNMRVARLANAPVILTGDIEKGGVFASLVGTLQLLDPDDRKRVIGVIINKFRGDVRLLESGLKWFEDYTGVPVLGVVPYMQNLTIAAEDSVALSEYTSLKDETKEIDIAVIQYPKIANFTDVDPFFCEVDCHVRFVTKVEQLGEPDLIILPGSKNTIEDLRFLKEAGLAAAIIDLYIMKKSMIAGICGGYQMLGKVVSDPFSVESPLKKMSGLGLLPLKTTISLTKTTERSQGIILLFGKSIEVKGYEIHMGESCIDSDQFLIDMVERKEGCKTEDEQVFGTYFHGIFHNDHFRKLLLNTIRINKGLTPIDDRLIFENKCEEAFNTLADHVKNHVNLEAIKEKMMEFQTMRRN